MQRAAMGVCFGGDGNLGRFGFDAHAPFSNCGWSQEACGDAAICGFLDAYAAVVNSFEQANDR